MRFLYKIVSYKTSICQFLRVTDSNTDYRAFIKRVTRARRGGERAGAHLQIPARLLMLPGAGCPLFLRAGGFSVLGTVARRRGRAWEGTWELKGEKRQSALCALIPTPLRKGVMPGEDQHLSAKGGAPTENGTAIGWARPRDQSPREWVELEERVSRSPSIPLLLPCLCSPLSGGPHPSGSLRSF